MPAGSRARLAAPNVISLASEALSAEIAPFGAELRVLRDREGRDLLWNGDPSVWGCRAPILFPIIGVLNQGRYRVGPRAFALPIHGLARRRMFSLINHEPTSALFRLVWNAQSLALYPFKFQLDVEFSLQDACLTMTATVANLDEQAPMPASFGFHPGFRWPLPYGEPRAKHRIVFDEAEPAPIRRISDVGLVRPQACATPVRRRALALTDELFVDDVVIFDQLRSRRLRYGAIGGPQLEIAFPQASGLGVWTKPGAGFVCIEPWRGVADPEDFTGDFASKPGVVIVPPLQAQQLSMSVTLHLDGPPKR